MKLAEKFAKEAYKNSVKILREKEESDKKKKEEDIRKLNVFLTNTLLPEIEKAVKEGKFDLSFTLNEYQKDTILKLLREYAKENGFGFCEAENLSMDKIVNEYRISWAIESS